MKKKIEHQGFTLLEMAIALIVVGFLASSILIGLRFYNAQERQAKTNDAIEESEEALISFYNENGRYPCPAPLDVAETDPDYGFEITAAAGLNEIEYEGRDIDSTITGGDADGEPYVVGAMPFKTILDYDDNLNIIGIGDVTLDKETGKRFAAKHSLDGYNQKITYAVTRSLCEPTNLVRDLSDGVIDVISARVDGEDISLLPDGKYAHFAVISHGKNSLGAYSLNGNEILDCMGTSSEIVEEDDENEDEDASAEQPLSDKKNCNYEANEGVFYSGLRNLGDEDRYFDDKIYFHYGDLKRIWSPVPSVRLDNGTPDDPDDDILLARMQNENDGFVGVGTTDPEEMLHVEGDIQAIEVIAEEYCDESGTCMPAEVIAGEIPAMQCEDGKAVKRIQNNSVECHDPFAGLEFSCPEDFYLQGMRSDGTAVCASF